MAQAADSASLLRTPLHPVHQRLGARLVPFGGWEMPLTYAGQLAEHHAVRQRVGIFDVSHMGQVRFTGPDALKFLQHLVPADIAALAPGKSRYTQLVADDGGTIDDLIVTCLGEGEYFAVVNASTRIGDLDWMHTVAGRGAHNVHIEDESFRWAMIAVQGPTALAMLDTLLPLTASATDPFTMHTFTSDGETHLLSRTGYTGEAGAELLCPAPLAEVWWNRLMEREAEPCGLAARDSLRLEAGYCLYGNDLSHGISPVEAGLSWSISWKKQEPYPGREALERQKAEGPARRLIGVRSTGRRPLRAGDRILHAGTEVGVVTSGGYSPVLEAGIALALVQSAVAREKTLMIAGKGAETEAHVVKPPFVTTSLTSKGK